PGAPALSAPLEESQEADLVSRALEQGFDVASLSQQSPYGFGLPTPATGVNPERHTVDEGQPQAASVQELMKRAGPMPVPVVVLTLRSLLRDVVRSGGDRRVAASTVIL